MKRWITVIAAMALCLALVPGAMAQPSQEEMMKQMLSEIQALKDRVNYLENKVSEYRDSADQASKAAMEARATSSKSLKMSQEVARTKSSQIEGLLTEAGKRLKVYGAVELEGHYSNYKPKSGDSVSESGFALSTAEIFFDATINKYTKGLVHLLYEDFDDFISLDEAFILIGQTDDIPAYFLGGKIYPAIALFETYMVSDPITQNLFELQATAAEIGWAQDWFNIGAGMFNSIIHEASDAPDDNINTFYVRAQFDAPEGALGEDVDINFGVAYINNIAAGNLGDEVVGGDLQEMVGGWSAMISAQYKIVAFTAEYMTAADDFKAGELSFDGGKKARPTAYNFELACMPIDAWTIAVRYEGSEDTGDFEPDNQYGLTVAWDFLPDTTLSVEYLHGSYENDDDRDLFTTQLAVGF